MVKKRMVIEYYPIVYRGKTGKGEKNITVLFKDHAEFYMISSVHGKKDDYDPESYERVARGSGDKKLCTKQYISVYEPCQVKRRK